MTIGSAEETLEASHSQERLEEGNKTGDSVISIDGLRQAYDTDDGELVAVDDISFDIEPGTVVGLLGPNGAGKTTTIKSMVGLLDPDQGRIEVAGVDIRSDRRQAYNHIAAMLEGARNVYWRLTVRENLRYFTALSGNDPNELREKHETLIQQLSLADKADTPVKELSRGMKQKVSLACTLARRPTVAFLDEPTLGLDIESSLDLQERLRRLAKDEGMTIVLSSHDMDVIESVCDRVLIMNHGRIVADDSVEGLVDVLHTQSFAFMIQDAPSDLASSIESYGTIEELESSKEERRFNATFNDEDGIYKLMKELDDSNATIKSIETVEPDLEDIFLQIVDDTAEGL